MSPPQFDINRLIPTLPVTAEEATRNFPERGRMAVLRDQDIPVTHCALDGLHAMRSSPRGLHTAHTWRICCGEPTPNLVNFLEGYYGKLLAEPALPRVRGGPKIHLHIRRISL